MGGNLQYSGTIEGTWGIGRCCLSQSACLAQHTAKMCQQDLIARKMQTLRNKKKKNKKKQHPPPPPPPTNGYQIDGENESKRVMKESVEESLISEPCPLLMSLSFLPVSCFVSFTSHNTWKISSRDWCLISALWPVIFKLCVFRPQITTCVMCKHRISYAHTHT